MKRQNLLKAVPGTLLVLLLLGVLTGCIHKPATVELLIHGPGIMKVPSNPDGNEGIEVFVPRDGEQRHELVTPDMSRRQPEKEHDCKVTVSIKLVGVDSFPGQPRFASTSPIKPSPFRLITFYVPKTWTVEDPFVHISLPSTSTMDFLEPLYPVEFEPGETGETGERGEVPLTEILHYSTTDIKKVKLMQTRVRTCQKAPSSTQLVYLKPLKCKEAQRKYQAYSSLQDSRPPEEPAFSQRPFLMKRLGSCTGSTYFYFVGVGLPETTNTATLRKHGIEFFNESLLKAIFGSEPIPPGRKMRSITPRDTLPTYTSPSARLIPAVWDHTGPLPRLVPVASTENCTAPGALAISR